MLPIEKKNILFNLNSILCLSSLRSLSTNMLIDGKEQLNAIL